jgi:hypothetical protein
LYTSRAGSGAPTPPGGRGVQIGRGGVCSGTMRITARLEEATVRQLLQELLPVTVMLDDEDADRWIRIDPARSVDFAAGEGLRVAVAGQLSWKLAGVQVTLTIHSAQLLLQPAVVGEGTEGRLLFRPSLEKMDLKNVPGLLDSGITGLVNLRLESEGDKLAWHFGRDLTARFPLGKDLVDVESLSLGVGGAAVTVLADAIVLELPLALGFERR